jgi:hypothetical protein
MKKSSKKLDLAITTIRVINPELSDVVGGKHTKHCPTVGCPPVTTWMTCPR